MRALLVLAIVAGCGSTPRTATTTTKPADATLKPAGSGWYCTTQRNGPGGGCFREEQMCLEVAVLDGDKRSYTPCARQATAYCHTHLFTPTNKVDFFCRPTQQMCDAIVADWRTPPSDYRDVSACAAWD